MMEKIKVKSKEEIIKDINEIEASNIPLDSYMKGYVNALKWILELMKNDN